MQGSFTANQIAKKFGVEIVGGTLIEDKGHLCPFSGGGDITIFGDGEPAAIGSGVIGSPLEEGEGRFLLDIECEVVQSSSDSGMKKLLANMILALSVSLKNHEKIKDLDSASCYGILLDRVPIHMFKIILDFKLSEIRIDFEGCLLSRCLSIFRVFEFLAEVFLMGVSHLHCTVHSSKKFVTYLAGL